MVREVGMEDMVQLPMSTFKLYGFFSSKAQERWNMAADEINSVN